MVNHGTQESSPLPEPTTTAYSYSKMSIPSNPAGMDTDYANSHTIGPIADDYDVTEKCLNWQNNCTTGAPHNLNSHTQFSCSTDNKIVYPIEKLIDNPLCLENCQIPFQEENTNFYKSTNDNAVYAYSSQEKLDGCEYCSSSEVLSQRDDCSSKISCELPKRIRRDSEESDESMETSSSMSSSTYAPSLTYKLTITTPNTSGLGNLIQESLSEDDQEQHFEEAKQISRKDTCSFSLISDPQKSVLTPVSEDSCSESEKPPLTHVTEDEIVNIPPSPPVPFTSHVEQPDPEFMKNPPVITDNLIYVEDEAFLHQSQNSLDWSPFQDFHHGKFLARASTLPDLHAYHRQHNEYGVFWGFQDSRIFLSEDVLYRSMCSLSNSDNMFIQNNPERGCSYTYKKVTHEQIIDVEGHPIKCVPNSNTTTAMILLSLCVSILFASTDVIRNLQTSLHREGGLGMTSLVLIFAGYTLGSLLARPLLQHVQPRVCLMISILPNILFLLANLSSTLWLLAPVSFLQGTSMAVMWSVLSTYITHLASKQALSKREHIKVACCRFFNYFSLIYQGLLLVGNLLSSVLLKYGNNMHNLNSSLFSPSLSSEVSTNDADQTLNHLLTKVFLTTHPKVNESAYNAKHLGFGVCGASYHNPGHTIDGGDPWLNANDGTIYMLHGTFIGCILVSLGLAVFGIEPLNTNLLYTPPVSESRHMKNLFTTIQRSFRGMILGCMTLKFVLLMPLFMYSVMQFGFISAEVTAAFITCSVGIDQIGFSMVSFVVGRFPTSFFCGFLTKNCGRLPLITIASAINLISLIVLAQWEPRAADTYLLHILMFCWGLSDGIWISQVNGLISSVFKLHLEATSCGMRVAQGLGVTIFLSVSKFVDMKLKIFIMMAACLLGLTGYLVMRICLYCENLHNQQQQSKTNRIYSSHNREEV